MIKGKANGNIVGGAIIIGIALVAAAFGVAPVRFGNSIDGAEHPIAFLVIFWTMIVIGLSAMVYGLIRRFKGLD